MKKLILSLFIFMCTAIIAFAQERTVSGTVTERETGNPLPGVTVRIRGDKGATQTESNGKYTIKVSASATGLEFSYLGFVTVTKSLNGSGNSIDIVLEPDAKGLSEVVVTGYSVQTRSSITGSQVLVKGEAFANVPNANVANTLQGKAPGLSVIGGSGRPGEAPYLRVRGTNSLTAGNNPLILIDGVDAPNLNSVNSEDIENVVLLKDAASTAIYGSRAANGVLLITTKKGKAGEPQFTYSFQSGIKQRVPDNFDLMNIDEKLQYEYDLKFQNDEIGKEIDRQGLPAGSTIFNVSPAQRANINAALKSKENNWNDILFRDGKLQEHQIGVSGTSEKMRYYVNLNRYSEDGTAISSSFKRTGGRINADYQAKKWLKVGTNLSVSYTQEQTVRESYNALSPFGSYYFINSYEPLREPNGTFNDTNQGINPYASIIDAPARANRLYGTGAGFVELTPIKDLLIRSNIGITYSKLGASTFYRPGSPVDRVIFGTASPGNKTDSGNENFFYIWTNTAQYTKTIATDHAFTLLGGTEFFKNKVSTYTLTSSGFASQDEKYSSQNNAAKILSGNTSLTDYDQVSFFGELKYDFKQKYFLSGSLRRDGSSRFGIDTRYGNFWSVGAAWNVLREDFATNIFKSFDIFKIRSSYGKTGNNQIANYQSQSTFTFGKYNAQSVIAETVLGFPGLTWENNAAFDLGLDVAFFNNRLRATFDYYSKESTDLLYSVPKSSTTGFGTRTENSGSMTNKGIEIDISADIIRNKDLQWTMSVNGSHNKNEITKLYGSVTSLPGAYTTTQIGLPINNFYLVRWAGINPDTGAEEWFDKAGNKFSAFASTGANQVVQEGKSPNPKYFGSVGTSVTYKGVSLSGQFYYNFGNYIYNVPYRDLVNNGNDPTTPQAAEALNYWKQKGDIVKYAKPVYGQAQPDRIDKYLQKGDYIRLRELTLSYNLPKSLISKAKIQNFRIYALGTNLFTWTKEFKGDPEVGVSNSESVSSSAGITSVYPYAPTRAFTFGVNLTL